MSGSLPTRSDSLCRIDSQGNHWFACTHGTVGCPVIHNERTPHCIACSAGEPCRYQHEPPALEMTKQEYIERYPEQTAYLTDAEESNPS